MTLSPEEFLWYRKNLYNLDEFCNSLGYKPLTLIMGMSHAFPLPEEDMCVYILWRMIAGMHQTYFVFGNKQKNNTYIIDRIRNLASNLPEFAKGHLGITGSYKTRIDFKTNCKVITCVSDYQMRGWSPSGLFISTKADKELVNSIPFLPMVSRELHYFVPKHE